MPSVLLGRCSIAAIVAAFTVVVSLPVSSSLSTYDDRCRPPRVHVTFIFASTRRRGRARRRCGLRADENGAIVRWPDPRTELRTIEGDGDDIDDDDGGGGGEGSGRYGEERRMSDVRAIQSVFYSSSAAGSPGGSATGAPRLDRRAGVFRNLPLWREKLGYTELPGRSLIGFVKDPSYTHMFETLLRSGEDDLYFGQLRLDNDDVGINVRAPSSGPSGRGGAMNGNPLPRPRETDMNAPLRGWEDRAEDSDAVVVGTLMRINDHVRLDDGRLMLLLHAMERFVVLEPRRKLPYPLADVMVLPDEEEIVAHGGSGGAAVAESLCRWDQYEFDKSVRFTLKRDETGNGIYSLNEVLLAGGGDALGSLLPFALYSSCDDAFKRADFVDKCMDDDDTLNKPNTGASAIPHFSEFKEKDILREVDSFLLERAANPGNIPSVDDIERDLWRLIGEYVRLREVSNVFPKHLLSLLPKNVIWHEPFDLDKLANMHLGMALGMGEDSSFARIADQTNYPDQRRQKRLSYACTALLGGPVNDHALLNRTMRRRLLEIPSTRGRLWAARELFEAYNSQFREKK